MTEPRTGAPNREHGADRAAILFGVGLALLVGTIVRVLPLVGGDFPLNDGGLFSTMVNDLVTNGFALPDFTTYNEADIPFAYPPLALYAAGGLHVALGLSVIDLVRLLPLAFSLAAIPTVYWLASGILGTRTGGVLAAICFALVPRAYWWMITGGGLTRGLGLLLALMSLGVAWRILRHPERGWGLPLVLGVLGALTLLAHPQAGLFAGVSILLFLAFAARRGAAVIRLGVAGAVALGLISPWLAAVVGQHGVEPLLSAASSGGGRIEGIFNLFSFRSTEMLFLDLIGIAGIVGAALAIGKRQFLLPSWLVVIWLVDSRAGSTFSMVPLSLLAAYCLMSASTAWLPNPGTSPTSWLTRRPVLTAAWAAVLLSLILGNYISALSTESPLFPLTHDQREAMSFVEQTADQDTTFVIVTGTELWESDSVSEWFPTLTGEESAATVQGFEWLGADEWNRRLAAFQALQKCATDVLPCVVDWAEASDIAATHVFLPKGDLHGPLSEPDCCPAPRHSVRLVPGAEVVYDGAGATIIVLP